MIEALNKRKVVREFLKSYTEELWRDIIPDVFEIGVLVLQTSYRKILFDKEELKDILSILYITIS